MKILSTYLNLPSTAAMYVNGKIVAATHEERFTRSKNDEAFPQQSIRYCLTEAGVSAEQLDAVAVASHTGAFDANVIQTSRWTAEDYLKEQHLRWLPYLTGASPKPAPLVEIFRDQIRLDTYPSDYWPKMIGRDDRNEQYAKDREYLVADFLGIDPRKVRRIEHHRCHAAYSYYASPFRGEKVLALTIDGWGDGLNATIGIFDESGHYRRMYETAECNIGRIYRYLTLVLGMKPNEHEYKVMGLAPYGRAKHAKKALDVFRNTLYVDGIDFKWHEKPSDSYFWFRDRLEGVRFDTIAYALQTWVEELLVGWSANAIKEFGIHKLVISGGVAMNIKAMGKIAALPEVDNIFIGGSASDESMAVSAGICLAEDLMLEQGASWSSRNVPSLPHLYLGPKASDEDEESVVAGIDEANYLIEPNPVPARIAELLSLGKIIARCAGRMEFGQRSLGNRSILADPRDLRVKERINAAIKSRDFWMPFAPVVLDRYVDRYLINPKALESPHMTIGFDTTVEGYEAMIAACHPADRTARAQILKRDANPALYEILEEFESITGRGALLNTSFNLHGYPIVNTPAEALDVLQRSGLDGLVLNRYLILKR